MSYQTPVGTFFLHKLDQELSHQFFFYPVLKFGNVGDPDAKSEGHFSLVFQLQFEMCINDDSTFSDE